MSRKKSNVNDLISHLAAEEDKFLQREFLAPALRGGTVHVQIGGVVCKIRIEPADFQGWGIFHPLSHTEAILPARGIARRTAHIPGTVPADSADCLPPCRQYMVRIVRQFRRHADSHGKDSRRCSSPRKYSCLIVSGHGSMALSSCLKDIDMRRDPGASAYLRTALNDVTAPEFLDRKGLTAEERAAYELNYWEMIEPPAGNADDDTPQRNPRHDRRRGKPRAGAPASRRGRGSQPFAQ